MITNPRQARKQLLILQSELNRELLLHDLGQWKERLHTVADRAQSWGAIAASVAGLVVAAAALSRSPTAASRGTGKSSWRQLLRRGAGLFSALWLALRPTGPGREPQRP